MSEEIKTLKDEEIQVIPKTTSQSVLNENKESIENDINLISNSIETTASTLNTITDKTGNNISQNLSELQSIKSDLKEAIIAKGVDVPYGTTFAEYAGKIGEIESSIPMETITITINSSYLAYYGYLFLSYTSLDDTGKTLVYNNSVQVSDGAVYNAIKGTVAVCKYRTSGTPDRGISFGFSDAITIQTGTESYVACAILTNNTILSE